MPAYHSTFNKAEGHQSICKVALLPVRTSVKGPVMAFSGEGNDVIDETLLFFKANVLFRNFEMKGDADRLLVYLTLFTSRCLKTLERCRNKADADKQLYTLAIENFKLPGDGGFPLNGVLPAAESRHEADQLRSYLNMCRQELALRLTQKVFSDDANAAPSKWWMCFSKKKFMNMAL